MENYLEYKMGYISQIRMRPGCIPTKFDCQHQPNSDDTSSEFCLPTPAKRPRLETLIEECEKELHTSKNVAEVEKPQSCENVCINVPSGPSISSDPAVLEAADVKCEFKSDSENDEELRTIGLERVKPEPEEQGSANDAALKVEVKCEFESDPEYDDELRMIRLEQRVKTEPSEHDTVEDGEAEKQLPEVTYSSQSAGTSNHHVSQLHFKRKLQTDLHADKKIEIGKGKAKSDRKAEGQLPTSRCSTQSGNTPHKSHVCLRQYQRPEKSLGTHLKFSTGEKPACNACEKQSNDNINLETQLGPQTGAKVFECIVCKKKFNKKRYLHRHLKNHSDEKQHKCNYCEKQFNEKCDFDKHLRTHTGEKPYGCSYCIKQFSEKSSLTKHIRIHTGNKRFKCNDCGKQFDQISRLKRHSRVHTQINLEIQVETHINDKVFECYVCRKQLDKKTSLDRHLRTHTGEKPFVCNFCEKQFVEKSSLIKHLRTHTGEKPYKCDYCSMEFKQNNHLKRHHRIHNGEKPYVCNICGKHFNHRESLKRHTKIHTGEKPYKCNDCGKRCRQKGELKVHLRKHTGEKPYNCDFCKKQFADYSNLKSHLRSHNRAAIPMWCLSTQLCTMQIVT